MSDPYLLLLKVKPTTTKEKKVKITLPRKTKVIRKTDTRDYDVKDILSRLKQKRMRDKELKPKTKKSKRVKLKRKVVMGVKDSETGEKTEIELEKEKVEEKIKTRKPRERVSKRFDKDLRVPEKEIEIGDELIVERIKPIKDVRIRSSAYYQNNRNIFINFISTLFEPYKIALKEEAKTSGCDKGPDSDFKLLTHQKIVRDYVNTSTPYRGVLLYHGLGSGKTCSSISIVEGFSTTKKIFIMIPASLETNYREELKFCGNLLFRRNQWWEFISYDEHSSKMEALSKMMHVPMPYIKRQKGIWLVNMNKKDNYNLLTPEQKQSLNKQIDTMINNKYHFIRYNGLRNHNLEALKKMYGENPFDNSVIVIDEVHNLVSRIVNKIGRRRKTLSIRLYELLMGAKNARIVALTGTPIVNYPNEMGILFNMLRGYIITYNIPLTIHSTKVVNEETIKKILRRVTTTDYISYKSSTNMLTITKNPFGFINKYTPEKYEGVFLNKRGDMQEKDFINIIKKELAKEDIDIVRRSISTKKNKALPDKLKPFINMFISSKNNIDIELQDQTLLMKRILGLTSYFRSAQEELIPDYDEKKDLIIEKIAMSDYQFGIYQKVRASERKQEKKNAKKKKMMVKTEINEIYNDINSTYRIFSRAFCNFVFPEEISRPMPKEELDLNKNIRSNIDENVFDVKLAQNKDNNIEEAAIEEIKDVTELMTDKTYEGRIKTALRLLNDKADEYLSPKGLERYSPKFYTILQNLLDSKYIGKHLIYSQFRTIEGIGLLSLVLDNNGFARFKIQKNYEGKWLLDMKPEDKLKPKYVLYTGTETREEKEIVRNIFNSNWKVVPSSLKKQVEELGENNIYGEIIKIFMITSSGSEGISLKNVRFVHITEPYWHPVRMEQIIGRARRICSHNDLPEGLRNVKVWLYLMKFTAKQLASGSKELELMDKSKLIGETITTDEALYEISIIKRNLSRKLLKSIKQSAFDCNLHMGEENKEGILCYSPSITNPYKYTYTPSIENTETDIEAEKNVKKITWKGKMLKIKGIKYVLNDNTKDVYDYESFINAQKYGKGQLILKGKLVKNEKGKYMFKKA